MVRRIVQHIQGNAIAYVALFFAIGGGGGYAVAATVNASTTIHACVSKKNGALYIDKRCGKTTKALLFNERGPTGATGKAGATGPTGPAGPQGAAGTSAVVAYGEVDANGQLLTGASGLSVAQTSTGNYTITVTAPECSGSGEQFPIVSPADGTGGSNSIPVLSTNSEGTGTFSVFAGDESDGTVTAGGQAFDVQDACAT